MYTSKDSSDVLKSIDGYDIFNSKFIYNVDNHQKSSYLITRYENRAELLAKDIYNNMKNYGLLLVLNRKYSKDMTIGTILKYIPENDLNLLK